MNLVVDLKRDHQRSPGTELMVNIKTTATDVRLGTGGNSSEVIRSTRAPFETSATVPGHWIVGEMVFGRSTIHEI